MIHDRAPRLPGALGAFYGAAIAYPVVEHILDVTRCEPVTVLVFRSLTWGRFGFDGGKEGCGCVPGNLGAGQQPQGCLNADEPLALAA